MKIWIRSASIGILLALLLTGCGGTSGSGAEAPDLASQGLALDELPEEIQELIAQEAILPAIPMAIDLALTPPTARPGGTISVADPAGLAGTATITHGTYVSSAALSAGSFAVPGDAPDGLYAVQVAVEGEVIGYGSFRVASTPGIWLSANGKYARADQALEIQVESHQVPPEMLAVFRLGDLAKDPTAEDGPGEDFELFDPFAFGGPSAYLLPDQAGRLGPGAIPGRPLSEFAGETFLLPGELANRLQVYALDASLAQMAAGGDFEDEAEDALAEGMEYFSNIVTLQLCDLGGEVSGDLGGPGTIRALSYDGELLTRSIATADGRFSFQLPAGAAVIEGWRENEGGFAYFPRQAVDVPCGEGVKLTMAAVSSAHQASPISLAPSASRPAQAGSGEDICERIYVDAPGALPAGFSDGDLLTSAIAAQLDSALSRASVATFFDNQALLEEAAKDQLQGGEGQQELGAISDNLSANLIIFNQVYELGGKQFASVTAFDKSGGWSAPFARAIIYGETLQELSSLPGAFVEKVQKAALCANIEPAEAVLGPNEILDLALEMTDLNGEAHEQVEINLESQEPLCGSLEWTEQTSDSTAATNRYTANGELSCTDTLMFVGETDGPQGRIKSNADDGTVKILKPILFHFKMGLVFYGEDGGTIDLNWDADFYADEGNTIKTVARPGDSGAARGGFSSQNVHCEVHENGVLTFRSEDLKPNATWDMALGGRMELFDNGFVDLSMVPVGTSWQFGMQPFPEECTVLLENLLLWFLRSLSLQPANFVPGGAYEMGGMTEGPLRVTYPLEGTSGFEVIITRAPMQARQP